MGCAGCGSPGEGEGSWAPNPEVGSAGRPHALVSLGRADAVALGEGEEGAGSVGRLGWLRKRKPSPASVPAPEESRRWAAMTGQKGILLEALEAEGEAGVKHR